MSEKQPKRLSTGMWVFLSVLLVVVMGAGIAAAVITTQYEQRREFQTQQKAKSEQEEAARFENSWRRKACFDDATTPEGYDMCNKRYPLDY